jgi:hypothetical protein
LAKLAHPREALQVRDAEEHVRLLRQPERECTG